MAGDEQRSDDPLHGGAPLVVAEEVAPREHDVIGSFDASMEFQQPALHGTGGLVWKDCHRTVRPGCGGLEQAVIVRRDHLSDRERSEQGVTESEPVEAADEVRHDFPELLPALLQPGRGDAGQVKVAERRGGSDRWPAATRRRPAASDRCERRRHVLPYVVAPPS